MAPVFDFEPDYQLLRAKPEEVQIIEQRGGATFLFENLFTTCLTSIYPQGLQGAKLRTLARFLSKLDLAQIESSTKIEILPDEVDLLKEVFVADKASVQPQQARLFDFYRSRFEKSINGNV